MTTTAKNTRFDHTNCKHATSGAEGKKARAKCRKEHAELAAKAAKKPAPRKRTVAKKPVSTVSTPVAVEA